MSTQMSTQTSTPTTMRASSQTTMRTSTLTTTPTTSPRPARRPRRGFTAGLGALVALVALVGASAVGCGEEPAIVTVEVTVGHETGMFSQDPKVTRVDVTGTTAEGDVTVSASAAPGGTFDLGEVPEDRLFSFQLKGFDAEGNTVVGGRSLSGILLSGVSGDLIPVFAQRLNQWARPASELLNTHVGGLAAPLGERYVILAGGSVLDAKNQAADASSLEFYDLFSYKGVAGPALPRAPRSMVARTSALLLIDDEGATWLDFQTGFYDHIARPAEIKSFEEVAGGQIVEAPDGRTFIVGPTKRDIASKAVLIVNADGSLDALNLPTERQGAAAAWIDDAGLVIAGGSATEPGVMVLSPTGKSFSAKPFPPDATDGAGAFSSDTERLTLVGGLLDGAPAATRTLDLRCSSACEAEQVPGATLPMPLVAVTAYAFASGQAIAIGDDPAPDGLMRTFVLNMATPSATELPLREPRRGATTTPAPNGTLALVGGVHADGSPALTMETWFPPE